MTSDPMAYILAAALISGAAGFVFSALLTARAVRQASEDAYWEGYGAANREINKSKL